MSLCANCHVSLNPTGATHSSEDPREQLQELESEILRVQALLAKLVQKRAPLKRNINRHYSPMLSLPVELCSEIFTTCFPPAREAWGSGTPLALGQVCTAWRNLAWSMPWLWNTVFLNSTAPSSTHVELLEQWVARAGHLPLSISFKLRAGDVDGLQHLSDLMDVVARYSKRWRAIDFDVPIFYPQDADPSLALCKVRPTSLPLLTSASVKVDYISSTLDMFLAAPQLSTVRLRDFPRNSVALPHHQITRLHLSPTTVQQCLETLGALPNLTHCTFEDITRSDVVNPSPVTAPRLETLHVISFTHTPLSELLDALLLPAARDLAFHVTGNTFPHWSFIACIARSACTLERLALTAVRISEWQLWDCLHAVPSLRALALRDLARVTFDTVRALNPAHHARLLGPAAAPLLPHLREFAYSGAAPLNVCGVANTLFARCGEERTRMDVFEYATSAPAAFGADTEELERIQRLVREGIRVSLVTVDGKWI